MRLEKFFVVYGSEHPAFNTRRIAWYRSRWLAEAHAWLFKTVLGGPGLWPEAWVKAEVEKEELLN